MKLYKDTPSKNYISTEDFEMSDDILEKIQDFLFNLKHKKSHKKTVKIYKHIIKNKTLKRR